MTALLPVIAVALSVGLVAAVAGFAWWRIDHLEKTNRRLQRRVAVERARSRTLDDALSRALAAGDEMALARHHTAAARDGLFPPEAMN